MFRFFAIVVLFIINVIFFFWIGFEMYKTLRKLKTNEGEKYVMYKRLSILLVLSICCSVVIVVTQIIILLTDTADEHFRAWWLWEGYWEFIYAACTFYVAWIWRPNDRNLRFAYIELGNNIDDDDIDHSSAIELDGPNQNLEESHSVSSDSDDKTKDNKDEKEEENGEWVFCDYCL